VNPFIDSPFYLILEETANNLSQISAKLEE